MNKRQKIIVSIVGITIVLLALLGITYAYYLTRIQGNTNTNSISITTADLKLVYEDGNGLLTASNIMPGKQVEFKTTGNQTTTEKTFTVTNSGNSVIEGYAVSLDYSYIADTMPSIFEHPEDFQITLTCTTSITGETCNGFTGNFNNESIMMTSNDIEVEETHSYSLSIYYNDPGLDQSNDMGKNLNLKVQIYGINETTDIEGTITGVDSTHSVRIESEPKMSTIVNGKYNFKGIEIGTHTLTVLDKDGNEVDKEYIVVKSGTTLGIAATTATVDGSQVDAMGITITNEERVARLTTKVESNVLSFDTSTSSTGIFNPYSNNKNTLAYNLINNAITAKENNSTTEAVYSFEPLTVPGKTPNGVTYTEGDWSSTTQTYTMESWDGDENDMYIIYGNGYKYDDASGRYIVTDVSYCNYLDCYQDMIGKYVLFAWTGSPSYALDDERSVLNYKTEYDIKTLSKIESVTTSGFTYKTKSSVQNALIQEDLLTTTFDEYGISYYYRGDVKNNYVTFSNMCWRIVRIQGDGTIKLILADESSPCSNGTYSPSSGDSGYAKNAYKHDKTIVENWANGGTYTVRISVDEWETKNFDVHINSSLEEEYLAETVWCYDESMENVSAEQNDFSKAYFRLSNLPLANPTLKCDMVGINNTKALKYTSKYGMLTADEAVFAGLSNNSSDLNNNYLKTNASAYPFWTATLESYETGWPGNQYYVIDTGGHLGVFLYYEDLTEVLHRPMVALKPNVIATIDNNSSYAAGTYQNPYVIN